MEDRWVQFGPRKDKEYDISNENLQNLNLLLISIVNEQCIVLNVWDCSKWKKSENV